MKQTDLVLEYCKLNKSITRANAIDLGVYDLPGVIRDIKLLGYLVTDKWEKGVNRYGTKTKWKRYWVVLK